MLVGRMLLALAEGAARQAAESNWWSEHSTLIVGVVGIVVSGFIGPTITAVLTSRRERQKDQRAYIVGGRDDLRALVDHAAESFGGAVSKLRPALQAEQAGAPLPKEAVDFLGTLFPLGQRLRLRLPEDDPVVHAYDAVREKLLGLSKATTSQEAFDKAADEFELSRAAFLNAARVKLQMPIPKE